jgi:hypothetical protein
MVLWQVNPNTSNGELEPTSWDAASQTGFAPEQPLVAQLGFQPTSGVSTAQMEGNVVGAYLNSRDLPTTVPDQKMMVTPQFTWSTGAQISPFASSNAVLSSQMDLQVPVAGGDTTYVVADFLFKDPNGVRISVGVKLFANGVSNPVVGTGYDVPSNGYMLNSPLGVDERFITMASGSTKNTGSTWLGWKHFAWSMTQAQFAAGLKFLNAQYPDNVQTTDPTQYVLAEVHLNAEFHYQPQAAELGWSMRGWTVSLAD